MRRLGICRLTKSTSRRRPAITLYGRADGVRVRRLVERGDDIAARAEDNHLTVLDWARRGGHQTVIDYLLSIGAPESEPTGDRELCR